MAQQFFQNILQETRDSFDRIAQFIEDSLEGQDIFQGPTSQQQAKQQQTFDDDILDFDEGINDSFASSPLEGMAEDVLSDIMSKQSGPQTFMEHVQAFKSAINWSEPFILCLIAFHVLVFTCTLTMVFKKKPTNPTFQLLYLATITIICRMAGKINTYGNQHWKDWGISQNYFDAQGFFVAVCLCVPLMLNCLIVLIKLLFEAGSLFIEVHRMKLKKQMYQQQKANKGNNQQKNNKKSKKKSKKQD